MLKKSLDINGGVGVKGNTPLARTGTPEEAAALVVFLLSNASSFITGVVYSIDGGWAC